MFHRHFVEEDGENSLLHLSSVFSTQDDHFFFGKIDGNRSRRAHPSGVSIGRERPCIINGVVRVEFGKLFPRGTDEHIAHEQSMIGSSANNAHADPVSLIPASVAINDIYSVTSIQVVDSTLSVDSPYLPRENVSQRGAHGT